MKRILLIIACFLLLSGTAFAVDDYSGVEVFYVTSFTGGGANSLDGAVSGVSIGPNDTALVSLFDPGTGVTRVYHYGVTLVSETETTDYPPAVVRPDDVGGGVTSWRIADLGYPVISVANVIVSGASRAVNAPDSGTSLERKYINTFVEHDQATSTIYGLPAISGVSVLYVKFEETAAGGGITVYNVNGEPFLGNGLSGTSYLALPPGNPFKSALVHSVQLSGTCKYWKVDFDTGWVSE